MTLHRALTQLTTMAVVAIVAPVAAMRRGPAAEGTGHRCRPSLVGDRSRSGLSQARAAATGKLVRVCRIRRRRYGAVHSGTVEFRRAGRRPGCRASRLIICAVWISIRLTAFHCKRWFSARPNRRTTCCTSGETLSGLKHIKSKTARGKVPGRIPAPAATTAIHSSQYSHFTRLSALASKSAATPGMMHAIIGSVRRTTTAPGATFPATPAPAA